MQIAGHRLGFRGEEFQQIVDRPAEDIEAQRTLQIADMLTEHDGGRAHSLALRPCPWPAEYAADHDMGTWCRA